jgi:hypothetical protein
MKKVKLTESQARSAVRKWLFEANYSPEQGSYQTHSTWDHKAGKLGDDRNNEMDLSNPVPIIAAPQMPSQLSWDMPPIDDPEWTPSTADEAARAAHQITSSLPDEQMEWYYGEMMKLRDKALERNKPEIAKPKTQNDGDIKTQISPKKAKKEEVKQESIKRRWMSILLEGGLGDDDEPPDWMEDAAEEFAEEEGLELDDVYQGQAIKYKQRRRAMAQGAAEQAEEARVAGEELSLRRIDATGVLPNITTLSGIRKYINSTINPHVEMWITANHLSRLMSSFMGSSKAMYLFFDAIGVCSMGGDALFTPDQVLELKGLEFVADALESAMRATKTRIGKKFKYEIATNPAKLKQYVQTFQNHVIAEYDDGEVTVGGLYEDYEADKEHNRMVLKESSLYRQILVKIIVEPIIQKWNREKAAGNIIMSRNEQNQISYEEAGEWLDEAVAIWENKSNGRKKKTVHAALRGLMEFRDAEARGFRR